MLRSESEQGIKSPVKILVCKQEQHLKILYLREEHFDALTGRLRLQFYCHLHAILQNAVVDVAEAAPGDDSFEVIRDSL